MRNTQNNFGKFWSFDSLEEFRREFERVGNPWSAYADHDTDWAGEEKAAALEHLKSGDTSAVKDAEKIINRISASVDIETENSSWGLDVAGCFPSVPAFLAGEAECMNVRRVDENSTGPVRVFVNTTSSGGISAENVGRRGRAILAFVLMLSRVRPVELYTFSGLGGGRGDVTVVIRHNSKPMMLSECAWALSSPAFPRGITYGFCIRHGTAAAWCRYENIDGTGRAGNATREALGCGVQDVVIGPAHINDELLENPAAWVVRELQRQGVQAATVEANK
jgi:hypothetical protein